MDGSYWIAGGGLLAIFVAVLKNNNDNNHRVNRVYQRLDEVKDHNDTKYTSRDICDVRSTQLGKDIVEIKGDVKELLRRNGGPRK